MPVEDDYMMVIIPCIAEIAASDTPERVKKLRLGALSELQRYGRVPVELYDCVFAGEVSAQTLEDIFYVFNMEHPSGYKGRSLSVSDVVEIFLASGGSEFYYCEPIGFKRIRFGKG